MGIQGGWKSLVGGSLSALKRERVSVVGKSVCWEIYGSLHRLIQGNLSAFPEEYWEQQSRNKALPSEIVEAAADDAVAANSSEQQPGVMSATARAALLYRVYDDIMRASACLLTTLKAQHVHVVLEGLHPAKATTHRKRRERSVMRPSDVFASFVERELKEHFKAGMTMHYPIHDADSQLAYLCATGMADYALVPSNDCDMVLFHGMKGKLVLSPTWSPSSDAIDGIVYRGTTGLLADFSVDMLRCYATMAGCDFFSCKNIGPKRAAELVHAHWNPALHPQENCDRVQQAAAQLFEFVPSTSWQVSTLAEAYSCFGSQLVRTTVGTVATVDEVSGVHTEVKPAPILLASQQAARRYSPARKAGDEARGCDGAAVAVHARVEEESAGVAARGDDAVPDSAATATVATSAVTAARVLYTQAPPECSGGHGDGHGGRGSDCTQARDARAHAHNDGHGVGDDGDGDVGDVGGGGLGRDATSEALASAMERLDVGAGCEQLCKEEGVKEVGSKEVGEEEEEARDAAGRM